MKVKNHRVLYFCPYFFTGFDKKIKPKKDKIINTR